jgi:Cu2+-containing amine oxidase
MLRVLPFLQHHPRDHQRAYPIDGLAAYVDLVERRVLHLIDHEVLPVPQEEGSFDDRPPSGRRGLASADPNHPAGGASLHRRRQGDVGAAWKHNDLFTGSSETRRMRRLVVSTFVAIGNYDYGFF